MGKSGRTRAARRGEEEEEELVEEVEVEGVDVEGACFFFPSCLRGTNLEQKRAACELFFVE